MSINFEYINKNYSFIKRAVEDGNIQAVMSVINGSPDNETRNELLTFDNPYQEYAVNNGIQSIFYPHTITPLPLCSPLFLASQHGHSELVEALLSLSQDKEVKIKMLTGCFDVLSPLAEAIDNRKHGVIGVLLRGSSGLAGCEMLGDSVRASLNKAIQRDDVETIAAVLDSEDKGFIRFWLSNNFILRIARENKADIVKIILDICCTADKELYYDLCESLLNNEALGEFRNQIKASFEPYERVVVEAIRSKISPKQNAQVATLISSFLFSPVNSNQPVQQDEMDIEKKEDGAVVYSRI